MADREVMTDRDASMTQRKQTNMQSEARPQSLLTALLTATVVVGLRYVNELEHARRNRARLFYG